MRYDRLLAGKNAVVTWAGSGIGAAVVRKFAQHGAAVAYGVPCAALGNEIYAELAPISPESFYVVCDLSDSCSVEAFMKEVLTRFADVDVLINNPHAFVPLDLLCCEEQQIEELMHIYQRSTMQTIRALFPVMKEKGNGSIVNLSSTAVRRPVQGAPLFTAATASMGGLTRVAALELCSQHVRVNELQAGFATDPDQLANVALFLASDMSGYITASTITADNGISKALVTPTRRDLHAE